MNWRNQNLAKSLFKAGLFCVLSFSAQGFSEVQKEAAAVMNINVAIGEKTGIIGVRDGGVTPQVCNISLTNETQAIQDAGNCASANNYNNWWAGYLYNAPVTPYIRIIAAGGAVAATVGQTIYGNIIGSIYMFRNPAIPNNFMFLNKNSACPVNWSQKTCTGGFYGDPELNEKYVFVTVRNQKGVMADSLDAFTFGKMTFNSGGLTGGGQFWEGTQLGSLARLNSTGVLNTSSSDFGSRGFNSSSTCSSAGIRTNSIYYTGAYPSGTQFTYLPFSNYGFWQFAKSPGSCPETGKVAVYQSTGAADRNQVIVLSAVNLTQLFASPLTSYHVYGGVYTAFSTTQVASNKIPPQVQKQIMIYRESSTSSGPHFWKRMQSQQKEWAN